MTLEIFPYLLGPLQNNTYLLADLPAGKAVIVDPAFEAARVVERIRRQSWQLEGIWVTHAHFDHIAGTPEVQRAWGTLVPVALHPADLPLWESGGGAGAFGVHIEPGPLPGMYLADGEMLMLGESQLEVRHIPGHSPGHVVFHSQAADVLLCGDVIFQGSIGRTDLPGGDYDLLIEGIRARVMDLPDATRLLPGHGPESTIGVERVTNPFL